MATVDVRFTALPAHVRTARLIALAVARRTGVSEELLDEVRLAVGEACSRAVGVHAKNAPGEPVAMLLCDDEDSFTVEVIDVGPLDDDPREAAFESFDPAGVTDVTDVLDERDSTDGVPAGFGLVVIGGLVDEVTVTSDETGTHVTMAWPVEAGRNPPLS
jgi:anti-sigma regulatory factor (Ser/Thr protein kinase)